MNNDIVLSCFSFLNLYDIKTKCSFLNSELNYYLKSIIILGNHKSKYFNSFKKNLILKHFENTCFDIKIINQLPILILQNYYFTENHMPICAKDMKYPIMIGVDDKKQAFIAFKQNGQVFSIFKKFANTTVSRFTCGYKYRYLWFKCNFHNMSYTFPFLLSNEKYILIEETIQIIEHIYNTNYIK